MVASLDILVLISWRVTMMLSSFASEAWEVELELPRVAWLSYLVLFFGVTYTCIESTDVYWAWPWVWILIFRRTHAFELQDL